MELSVTRQAIHFRFLYWIDVVIIFPISLSEAVSYVIKTDVFHAYFLIKEYHPFGVRLFLYVFQKEDIGRREF